MVTPEVIDFIKKQKAQNVPPEHYRALLLSQGWVMSDIELAEMQAVPNVVPLPPAVGNAQVHTIGATILGTLEMLGSIFLLVQILLMILAAIPYLLNINYPNFYVFSQVNLSQFINTARINIQEPNYIVLPVLALLVVVSVVTNLILKKKRGMKSKSLKITTRFSIAMIAIWFLLGYYFHVAIPGMF